MRTLAAVVWCALAAGCSSAGGDVESSGTRESPPGTPSTVAARARRPVTLPDLTGMVAPVQQQIREAHAAVEAGSGTATPGRSLADAYGTLGRLLLAADYPDSAEPCFLNARQLSPGDHRWPYYLAHIQKDRGQLEQARTFFEEVLALRPDDVDALIWLGDLSLTLGQVTRAESHFSRALALAPGSLSARFGIGRAALANGDYRSAITHLTRVLEQDPSAAAAHYPLALAYQGVGDEANAAVHLRQREDHQILPADPLIVELDELLESPQAYETRGIRALNQENWAEAEELFRSGLGIAPDNAALRHRLGTALFLQGNPAGARAEFEQAVRLSPDYFPAQFSLGVMLQDEGRHREAVARFEEALRHRPTYVEARVSLAANLRRLGRSTEALDHYGQVLSLDAGITEALFGRAMALVELGRYGEARDRLRAAMQAHPDEPVFAHALARVLAGAPEPVRNGPEATALVEPLIEAEPRTIDLGETYAMALAAAGEYGRAAALQNELVRGAEGAGFGQLVPRLRVNLARYQQGRPAEAPWPQGQVP